MLYSLSMSPPALHSPFITVVSLWLLFAPAPSFAIDPPNMSGHCLPWSDTFASREALVVGTINVQAGDLFDVRQHGQDLAVHRVTNALHVATRESTIRDALTVAVGDPFSLRALAEAERALRSKRYLSDASIAPRRLCNDAVDIDVRTVDNWTLTPSLTFGSAGGVSRFGVELQDLNLFGLGKELVFRLKESDTERSALFGYIDDNVFGSRHRLALELGNDEDGEVYGIAVGLPFYTASTPHSWWVSARSESDTFDLVADAPGSTDDDNKAALVDTLRVDAQVARQRVLADGDSLRHHLGVRHERQTTTLQRDSADASDVVANDIDELYPYVGVSWQHSRWSERQNYIGLGRTEDIDLGAALRIEAGLVLEAFGSDRDALRVELASRRGWQSTPSSLHLVEFGLTRYIGGPHERHAEAFRYQHFRWLSDVNQLDLQLVAERHVGQSPAHAFLLGGEYGLKGYPNAYARGGSRVIGLAELRHVTPWNPFELTRAALTAFTEIGRIGTPDATGTGGLRSGDTLADVGVGLVLAPTRSSRGAVFRFDLAVPLVGGEDVDDFQLFAGTQIRY